MLINVFICQIIPWCRWTLSIFLFYEIELLGARSPCPDTDSGTTWAVLCSTLQPLLHTRHRMQQSTNSGHSGNWPRWPRWSSGFDDLFQPMINSHRSILKDESNWYWKVAKKQKVISAWTVNLTWLDGRIWTEISVLTSNLIWLGGRIWIETLCRPEILL